MLQFSRLFPGPHLPDVWPLVLQRSALASVLLEIVNSARILCNVIGLQDSIFLNDWIIFSIVPNNWLLQSNRRLAYGSSTRFQSKSTLLDWKIFHCHKGVQMPRWRSSCKCKDEGHVSLEVEMYAMRVERRHCKNCKGGYLNKYPLDGLVGGCRDRMDNPERKPA